MTQLDPCVFPGCSSLIEIVIPEGVTKIGSGSFDYCRSLTDIFCYSEVPPEIYQAFDDVPIEQVTVHDPVNLCQYNKKKFLRLIFDIELYDRIGMFKK